jgi:hypothetical protein
MSFGNLTIYYLESVSLASNTSEDSTAIETEIERLSEGRRRVGEETNLPFNNQGLEFWAMPRQG